MINLVLNGRIDVSAATNFPPLWLTRLPLAVTPLARGPQHFLHGQYAVTSIVTMCARGNRIIGRGCGSPRDSDATGGTVVVGTTFAIGASASTATCVFASTLTRLGICPAALPTGSV